METYAAKEKLKIQVLTKVEKKEHLHQDIELIYIMEGTMTVSLEKQKINLKPRDILVINANKLHSYQASKDILFTRLSIQFQLFSDIFHTMSITFWCDSTKGDNQRYEELRKVIQKLLKNYFTTRGKVNNFRHIVLCYQIMDILSTHFMIKQSDREHMNVEEKYEERIQKINNYIQANYYRQISLNELSEELFLSNAYLSRFFKKNYGMNFAEYLTKVRLYHAVDDLLYSKATITRIAYDNGFASAAAFNKFFKKMYGETPSVIRKAVNEARGEQENTTKNPEIEQRMEHFLQNEGMKDIEKVPMESLDICCSVKNKTDLKNSWNDTINIGTAADLLRSEVQEHMRYMKDTFGIRYVRFWNLFSKEMMIDVESQEEHYNFSKIDFILDSVLQMGIKPHIELGMKPKRLFKNVQDVLMNENIEDIQFDHKILGQLLNAFMHHLERRYRREELDQWRIEIWFCEKYWNQEDLIEKYFDIFDQSYEIIKKYSKKIEVGGCGIRINYNEENTKFFLKKWEKRKYKPDFLSFMYYAYERGEIDEDQYSKRVTDNEYMLHEIQKMKKVLKESKIDDIKIYITEWNLTISDRNFINDSNFKGAYIIKNILDTYGMVDQMAYYLGTDCVTEYFDSDGILHGGTGLISKDGILKPAGFAINFMNRLYKKFV